MEINSSSPTTPPPCVSLKRKRPPKIQIPLVLQEIQTNQIKPRDQVVATRSYDDGVVGVFSIKGRKKFMEDTHKIILDSPSLGVSNKGFFGVFDGHGGRKAADFAAENLCGNIMGMLEKCEGDSGKGEAIKAGYLKTDEEFLNQGLSSGTCCVTCLIQEKNIVVSNLGDCRAVINRDGLAQAVTKDHKAAELDERKRIENKGGYVQIHRGAWRVHGILSVSRSIGDAHLKEWVTAEPDTKILSLTPDMKFLVLASDGLWEKVSNQEAIDTASLARSRLCTLGSTGDGWIDENKFGSENKSPPSKSQRLLSVMQHKMNSSSPTSGVKEDKDGLCCLNITPLKSCDILFGEQQIKNIKFPIHEPTSGEEKDGDFFFCESTKSPSKSRRISLVKQHKQKKTNFTTQENNSAYTKKLTLSGKEDEYEFCCENTSPSKTWETSLVNQQTVTPKFPNQECNNYPKKTTSGWNVAACKDLVNLAASRGSLDDITVMIIDLEHFRCNSQSQ